MDTLDASILDRGLFGQLRRNAGLLWSDYVGHNFVRALGEGVLPTASFRRYLTQDYLFLIQFARAYALAGYKSETLDDLRAAAAGLDAVLREMPLHVSFCAQWGLTEAEMAAEPEAMETVAYTRFVLERGLAGDLLDLQVVLAPCVLGYAEIGARLNGAHHDPAHPYAAWIATYAGAEYQQAADDAMDVLDRLADRAGGVARLPTLQAHFNTAVRMETAFWEMGWRATE
jgi:thiaminase/transcriptional activator TenA